MRVKRGWLVSSMTVSSGELMHHGLGVISNILLNDSKWLEEKKDPHYKEMIVARGSGCTALLFGLVSISGVYGRLPFPNYSSFHCILLQFHASGQ